MSQMMDADFFVSSLQRETSLNGSTKIGCHPQDEQMTHVLLQVFSWCYFKDIARPYRAAGRANQMTERHKSEIHCMDRTGQKAKCDNGYRSEAVRSFFLTTTHE